MDLAGGCFCGAVRYRVTGTVSNATICHCESCRKVAGAPAVAWFTAPVAAVEWQGALLEFQSSAGVMRSFCGACGTPIGYRTERAPGELDITLCSLDQPAALAPRDHTQTADKLAWDIIGDGLPRFPHSRGEGGALQG